MKPFEFSPTADGEWQLILDRDRFLAERIEPLLDQIENGSPPGERFDNHARFTALRVPGRDGLYVIVWEDRNDHYYALRIGLV